MPNRHPRHRSVLHPRNDDGLTLVEMIVAVGVTMVVLVSAGAAFVRMGEAQRSAEAADRGTQMIQDRMETIRKLTFDQVGCYENDRYPAVTGPLTCPLNAPVTPENASSNELTVRTLGSRPGTVAGDPIDPTTSTDTVIGKNKYTVSTVVTWADTTIPGRTTRLLPMPTLKPAYASKRITVNVSWKLGTKTRTVSRQWLRSPGALEGTPPKAGPDKLSHCPDTGDYPFCSISITEGQVLNGGPSFTAAKKLDFSVQMSQPVTAATVKFGGVVRGMAITNGGKTLTYGIAASGATGVKPGKVPVSIVVTSLGMPKTADRVINWRLSVPVANDYQLTNLHAVAAQTRTTVGDTGPTTGSELASDGFCVTDSTSSTPRTLLRYTAVIFDEEYVDEMDFNAPGVRSQPVLYTTSLDPADPNVKATVVAHPTTPKPAPAVPTYTADGFINGKIITAGSLNKVRWSYGFAPGTVFPGAKSDVIVSGERPLDGAAASATLTMPIYEVPNVSFCPTAGTYEAIPDTPTDPPTVIDKGNGVVLVEWGPQARATSYVVSRSLTGVAGTYTDVSGTITAPDTSFTDSGPAGGFLGKTDYFYKFAAINVLGKSGYSPAAGTKLAYASLVLGESPLLYYKLDEAAPPPPVYPLHPALVGYWKLETDGSNLVGTGNGQGSGATFGNPGSLKPTLQSALFNPVIGDSFYLFPNSALSTTGAMTIEAWIKPEGPGNYRMIATKGTANGATVNTFELRLDPTGKLQFLQFGASLNYATSTAVVSNSVWHHVAATKDAAGVVTLYIDGVANASAIVPGTPWPASSSTPGGNMWIGQRADGVVANGYKGLMSDVGLYSAALTSAEIAAQNAPPYSVTAAIPGPLSQAGYWKLDDPGPTAYNQVPGGDEGTGWAQFNYAGPLKPTLKSAYFDGFGGLAIPSSSALNTTGAMTIEAWIRPTTSATYRVIGSKTVGNGATDNTFEFRLDTTGKLQFVQANGTTFFTAGTTAAITMNTWHHVAVTKSSMGATAFYVDGAAVACACTAVPVTATTNTSPMLIGKRADGNYFLGYMSDVALWPSTLTPAQISDHFVAMPAYLPPPVGAVATDSSLTGWHEGVYTGAVLGQPRVALGAPGTSMGVGSTNTGLLGRITTPVLPIVQTAGLYTTVELWANIPAGASNQMLFSTNGGYTAYQYAGRIGFNTLSSSDVYGTAAVTGNHHYVFIFRNGGVSSQNKLYIDGVLKTPLTLSGGPATARTFGTNITIGGHTDNNYQLVNSTIDEFAVYPGDLSLKATNRILAHFNAGN